MKAAARLCLAMGMGAVAAGAGQPVHTLHGRVGGVAPWVLALPGAGAVAGEAVTGEEVPERYLDDYFGGRPETFVVDPQKLLGKDPLKAQQQFLQDHADDSKIDLYLYLFKAGQKIPADARAEKLPERLVGEGRPAAVVFYYLGEPQRAALHLSPRLSDAVSPVQQRQALANSIMQAAAKQDALVQLDAFLTQMAIRIYWMERALGAADESHAAGSPTAAKAGTRRTGHDGLERLRPLLESARRHGELIGGVAALIGAVVMTGLWWRSRKKYEFPEWAVEPRLGGDNAAGIGAVISFVSPRISPASQRDQLPEYLRRM